MMAKLIETGSTLFVQACARIMGAAWILGQMKAVSTDPSPMNISGIAYSLRFTAISDVAMGIELAVKTLAQGLSSHRDGEPQVLQTHRIPDLWNSIREEIRNEIDDEAKAILCDSDPDRPVDRKEVLSFSDYIDKHSEFFDTVSNRYAMPGDLQWKSEHVLLPSFIVLVEGTYKGRPCVDGTRVFIAYFKAIMLKALYLRWPDENCDANEGLAKDRVEAKILLDTSVYQWMNYRKLTR